ncbi:hypothetical protein [Mesohalobacter halotolerans]|uniref:Phosphopeptide-binding protein n=1 Tax=Mesohalobacter halotolerans TaxID=1883405 RepID=A0A4U5TQ63_9FLAO|nr:hypothetical protein [Mesohalobacter halotolerans]MBS3738418.1 hypothetical protein [Psychroflexus sp.]TKS55588.1 hypothetical protein FCN74_11615 [Mesohalobacter halotolerans]
MKNLVISCLSLLLILMSCKKQADQNKETENKEVNTEERAEESKITLSKFEDSPKFEDAKISLNEPDVSEISEESGKAEVKFDFNVENYELGIQTDGAGENGLANSGNGQHIHFILDNAPYSAHYEPSFSKEIEEGHHVLLAFLSRSYHESVKNAFLVQPVTVGDPEGEAPDLTAPHMFYSRPKGTYSGKGTEKLLLDFFLVNTEISETGNKVKAKINGEEFTITEWVPYVIEGLDKGEVEIQLQLVDAEGNLIPGPFNDVTRTVTLK